MPSEPLSIFDPRRTMHVQGFSGRGATTTLHDATATGVSVSGIFQAAEDFSVLCMYNAYDYFNHLRLKPLPRTDLSGLKLEFDIEYDQTLDGAIRLDAAKYPSVSWNAITFVCGTGDIYEVRLLDHATAVAAQSAAKPPKAAIAINEEGDSMRAFLVIATLGLTLGPLHAAESGNRTSTPVADALDWYSVWWSLNPNTSGVQTCRGELRTNSYSFRCDPLSVVIGAVVRDSGHCSITFMRPSVSLDDGLRVQTLEHLVPPRTRTPVPPRDCGELPTKEGRFELTITPRSGRVNSALTSAARDAALAYNKRSGDLFCLLRFPNVKTGDPFFHVYEECQGVLDGIWEFTIEDGEVADFAHWFYNRRRGFPNGTEWRRDQMDLWFGVSRPEERKAAQH
jgi:hypothetical protein